uniref:Uncharacterized protein n=1 Tax=Spironucleus salmonicida TaxID=348837 RepID=V6LTM0_9EUKA|eukprot:EST44876.1 Hypothetical protein SS50377_15215 [Spironucleus salmonicida]
MGFELSETHTRSVQKAAQHYHPYPICLNICFQKTWNFPNISTTRWKLHPACASTGAIQQLEVVQQCGHLKLVHYQPRQLLCC